MKPDQRKIIKHVQSGSLLKLKTVLEKLTDKSKQKYNLNFKVNEMGRTPLHIACLLGDDAVVRCLLKHGAASDALDRNRDTPVHMAAQFILDDGNYEDYKLLIEPLIRKFPQLLSQSNKAGDNPADILLKAREKYKLFRKLEKDEDDEIQEKADKEEEWKKKLQSETEAEFYESSGRFATGTSGTVDDDYQTYDQWADRIFQDYQRKHVGMKNRKRRKEFQSRKRKEEMDDITAHLQKNQDEYVAQLKRMKTEVMTQKREKYERKVADLKSKDADSKLRFRDIPWPCQGNAAEMVEVLLSNLTIESSYSERKRTIVKQLVLWHPDKFRQRCEDRLAEKDKERILETVKAITQELNKNLQSLKSDD